MVDIDHLGQSKDIAIRDSTQLNTANLNAQEAAWKRWASESQRHGNPIIVQLNHPGRQSPAGAGSRGFFGKTVAPSAIPLNLGDGYLACLARAFIFGTPRALTIPQIEEIVQKFAKSAKFCADVGMSGVELHAAHGYLLAQFLSPKSNARTDAYGGTPEKRAKIVLDIINETRKLVPKTFCIGIKLNSADVQHASSMDETLHQIKLIADAGVDFMEISGGSYENPVVLSRPPPFPLHATFPNFPKKHKTRQRS
jgi:2,4-dienoyl-CoA reductase-like NADH-dependent reductase (Old Yellow Enzyme family)